LLIFIPYEGDQPLVLGELKRPQTQKAVAVNAVGFRFKLLHIHNIIKNKRLFFYDFFLLPAIFINKTAQVYPPIRLGIPRYMIWRYSRGSALS
jgi:hypothetical protein